MSADKYPSIFSRQMATIVYVFTDAEAYTKTPHSNYVGINDVTSHLHIVSFRSH